MIQSLIVSALADCITLDPVELRRDSVTNTDPPEPTNAELAPPKILHANTEKPPAPVVVTVPFICNPDRPINPVVSLRVIFPLMLQGCLFSPV